MAEASTDRNPTDPMDAVIAINPRQFSNRSNNNSGNDKELNAEVQRRVGVYMRQYLWQYLLEYLLPLLIEGDNLMHYTEMRPSCYSCFLDKNKLKDCCAQ